MGNDLLGGLGGLMKGLSGLMPQDDPNVKLLNLQMELNENQKKEQELYAKVGMKALEKEGDEAYSELSGRLWLVQRDIRDLQTQLNSTKQEIQEREKQIQTQKQLRTCPDCDTENPEGVKFCQEYGTAFGGERQLIRPQYGTENPPETRFCGNCGRNCKCK